MLVELLNKFVYNDRLSIRIYPVDAHHCISITVRYKHYIQDLKYIMDVVTADNEYSIFYNCDKILTTKSAIEAADFINNQVAEYCRIGGELTYEKIMRRVS